MSNNGLPKTAAVRLNHVALICADLEACEAFYAGVLGLVVVWRPDPDNVYLSSGSDNLALHRGTPQPGGARDHIGFSVASAGDVDVWHERLQAARVRIAAAPRTHRDGSRSLYCNDPEGTLVQLIFLPPQALSPAVQERRGP
ncbi:VOC family protein [Acidiferrobacter sp.]|uniref:VOC family protein n=1 Tax=Acidiferrobacter sp. TaxID=1872107 RepID=UPI00261DC1C7|nr:VOC family protein [Acidiferrobacter sp.]